MRLDISVNKQAIDVEFDFLFHSHLERWIIIRRIKEKAMVNYTRRIQIKVISEMQDLLGRRNLADPYSVHRAAYEGELILTYETFNIIQTTLNSTFIK